MEGDLILIKVEGHFGQIFIHSLLIDFGLLVFESASVSAYCISLLVYQPTHVFVYLSTLFVYHFFLYTCLPVRPFTLPFEESFQGGRRAKEIQTLRRRLILRPPSLPPLLPM